jgi:hypothetical protein
MLTSFEQLIRFNPNGIVNDFKSRLHTISAETSNQRWQNKHEFAAALEKNRGVKQYHYSKLFNEVGIFLN